MVRPIKRSGQIAKIGLLCAIAALAWSVAWPDGGATQDAGQTLEGEFAVTIAEIDVPRDLINGAALIGRWRIIFSADGTYLVERHDVGMLMNGRFVVDGDLVILEDEGGLLSCSAGGTHPGAAIYEWAIADERLQLVAIDEECAQRRLLLTTRTLSLFVSCPVQPAATPIAGTASAGTPAAAGTPPANETAMAIDELLTRMSACWATGEPERFLALVSDRYRPTLVSDDAAALRQFALAMTAPIVWERAGDVEPVDARQATAIVRQTSGDLEDFVRYRFVYENGAWRWDGQAEDVAEATPAAARE